MVMVQLQFDYGANSLQNSIIAVSREVTMSILSHKQHLSERFC